MTSDTGISARKATHFYKVVKGSYRDFIMSLEKAGLHGWRDDRPALGYEAFYEVGPEERRVSMLILPSSVTYPITLAGKCDEDINEVKDILQRCFGVTLEKR